MRILSIFIMCTFVMQGAVFAAPQCMTAKAAQCSCCKDASQKCSCCSAEVPKKAGNTSRKNVPLSTSSCNCTLPAAPQRHETAAFISENSGFEPLRFAVALPVIMPWECFNYLRASVAATPPPVSLVSSPALYFPLRI